MELVPEAFATQRESVEQVNEYLRSFSSLLPPSIHRPGSVFAVDEDFPH